MTQLTGKWQLQSVENFDAYQKIIGVNDEQRARGNDLLCRTGAEGLIEELEFTDKTGKRTISVAGQTMGGKEFPLGVEFDAPTLDGRKTKTKIVADSPSKITRYDTFENGVSGVMTYELVGANLKTTLKAGDVVSVRVMKKI